MTSVDPSDAALLAATADGDRDALAVLYRRHSPWLLLRLSRRCADPDLVDQALQDTFVAAWRSAGRYHGDGEVAAWLWGIAIRRLLDHLRKRPLATRVLADDDGESVVSAEDAVLLGTEYGDLAGARDRLSPDLRAVVQATVLDGLTAKEAGRLLGLPAGTVKTRMMRARARLREDLA